MSPLAAGKKICPEMIIVLGEDLTPFRDVSKTLYNFLRSFVWSKRVERLGFDEVFMDVTDMIDFNVELLNVKSLENSFFHLSRTDPTVGFPYNASAQAGPTYPRKYVHSFEKFTSDDPADRLATRLILGSHLALHIHLRLQEDKGYTATVGVSTNKLLAKLVGNVNKPRNQTTLMPPYIPDAEGNSNVITFIDAHQLRDIPGIGSKTSRKIRARILGEKTQVEVADSMFVDENDKLTVGQTRLFPGMGPALLEDLVGAPGSERGLAWRIWGWINGVDDSEVAPVKVMPTQISIEDTYKLLDTHELVMVELIKLTNSLLKRMHTDLLEDDDEKADVSSSKTKKRWIAHPRTLRLSTRGRPPGETDSSQWASWPHTSRTIPLPNFVFNLQQGTEAIVQRLVNENLIPLFRKMVPEKSGWNLVVLNVAVTNMIAAGGGIDGEIVVARDIGKMFKTQEATLKLWRVEDKDVPPDEPAKLESPMNPHPPLPTFHSHGSEDSIPASQDSVATNATEQGEDVEDSMASCEDCEALMPHFALASHARFHALE
ncbi:MAG: hypothetical protein M1829_002358 [Trizodia sp. TS-e1964]|nr:MAG: hypothetical protein M1829_002358 [Trizodia sp. TS-e1964]